MKCPVVEQYDFKLLGVFFWELIQKYLKCSAIAKRNFHFKMLSRYGWKRSRQIARLKNLLKGTDGLDTFQSKPLSIPGKQAEPTFVLAIKVYAFVVALALGDDFLTGLIEVFLKASTACESFFTWNLRATFIFALNFRTTKPWKVL